MSLWRQLTHGLRVLTQRKAADQDVSDEVQHFLDEATAAAVASGLSPEEARRAAQVEIGSTTFMREHVRANGWEDLVSTFVADLRYAVRQLRSNPGSILSLTLAWSRSWPGCRWSHAGRRHGARRGWSLLSRSEPSGKNLSSFIGRQKNRAPLGSAVHFLLTYLQLQTQPISRFVLSCDLSLLIHNQSEGCGFSYVRRSSRRCDRVGTRGRARSSYRNVLAAAATVHQQESQDQRQGCES